MTFDEAAAIEEVKGLSENARRYLQVFWRNGLQSFLMTVEMKKDRKAIRDEVWNMSAGLKRLRL